MAILLLLFLMIPAVGFIRNPPTIVIQPAICWPASTRSGIESQQRRMEGASGSSSTLRKVHGPLLGPLLSPRPPPQVCTRRLTATTKNTFLQSENDERIIMAIRGEDSGTPGES
jgi:hypothetical protein